MLNKEDHNSFYDLFSVCLRTFDHLNLKLLIFSGHEASFKTGVSKVQDLEILNFHPCNFSSSISEHYTTVLRII